ncbi:MAG: hypothetical protein Q7J67_02545 [bacterium]|nr:hypothetical protein [bacterium]
MCRVKLVKEQTEWLLKYKEEAIGVSSMLPQNKINKNTNVKIVAKLLDHSEKLNSKEKGILKKWRMEGVL